MMPDQAAGTGPRPAATPRSARSAAMTRRLRQRRADARTRVRLLADAVLVQTHHASALPVVFRGGANLVSEELAASRELLLAVSEQFRILRLDLLSLSATVVDLRNELALVRTAQVATLGAADGGCPVPVPDGGACNGGLVGAVGIGTPGMEVDLSPAVEVAQPVVTVVQPQPSDVQLAEGSRSGAKDSRMETDDGGSQPLPSIVQLGQSLLGSDSGCDGGLWEGGTASGASGGPGGLFTMSSGGVGGLSEVGAVSRDSGGPVRRYTLSADEVAAMRAARHAKKAP